MLYGAGEGQPRGATTCGGTRNRLHRAEHVYPEGKAYR